MMINNDKSITFAGAATFSSTIGTGLTEGSVPFINSSGDLAQDNSNLFWDDSNNRLGIGTTSPSSALHISGGTGSVDVLIEADTDNSGESHQISHVIFLQLCVRC